MNRIVVIGSSCSGKSTFSESLAKKLNIKYIELDQLHWLPNWVERPDDEFRELVSNATSSDAWVIDGNYSVVKDIFWPSATQIIWLNHPFHVVLYRSISRSIVRIITKKVLFSENIESFKLTFLSKNSIILWVLKTYHKKKRTYSTVLKEMESKGIKTLEFTNQSQVDQYLNKVIC